MTDVKLFTHAFSANVSTESAHLKHDGLIRVVEFLQINHGHVGSCTTGPAKIDVFLNAFIKIHAIY